MQCSESSVQSPASSAQSPASSVQRPMSRVQNPVSRVQRLKSSVQNSSFRVQRSESSVQSPTTRAQRPTIASRVQEFWYAWEIFRWNYFWKKLYKDFLTINATKIITSVTSCIWKCRILKEKNTGIVEFVKEKQGKTRRACLAISETWHDFK